MDFERLRDDLKDYFGTAMAFNPMAVVELSIIESASNEKLTEIATQNGFDLNDYEIQKIR